MPKVLYPPGNITVHNVRRNEINPAVNARILQDRISVEHNGKVYPSLSKFLNGIGKSRRHMFCYVDGEHAGKYTSEVGVKSNKSGNAGSSRKKYTKGDQNSTIHAQVNRHSPSGGREGDSRDQKRVNVFEFWPPSTPKPNHPYATAHIHAHTRTRYNNTLTSSYTHTNA